VKIFISGALLQFFLKMDVWIISNAKSFCFVTENFLL